jgi:hypothetical protein
LTAHFHCVVDAENEWRYLHSRAVFVVGPATQHDCHHDTKVKPETVTAVIELLMMGGKKPETC